VRCEHLGDLVLVREGALEMLRCSEMTVLAVTFRERLVGDMAHEVLQEPVLPALRRSWIGLHAEHLLANEAGEQRLELLGRATTERSERTLGESLSEHRPVLQQPPLFGRDAVEPGRNQRVQRLRHLERLDLPGRAVDRALLDEQPSVQQHADSLDRVQRHALCARKDPGMQVNRQARNEPFEQLTHRGPRERIEVERCEVALSGAPVRPLLLQFGPGQRDHEQGIVARPLEQVLDEVEE